MNTQADKQKTNRAIVHLFRDGWDMKSLCDIFFVYSLNDIEEVIRDAFKQGRS